MAGYVPKLYQAVDLSLKSTETSIRIGSGRRKRSLEQDTASRKRIATEASVHFRQQEPRSFLWRVLDDGHLLEIQCVDLVTNSKEDSFTFDVSFTSPIISKGVAFANASDALQAFVLTTDNDLHVVTINRDLIIGKTTTQPAINTFSTGLWKHANAFKLTALTGLDLIISLTDGGLLRLERGSKDARWRETLYTERGGLLRGLFKRNQTVRYDDRDIDANTAVSVAAQDGLIWTVTLNHTLTAWRAGQVVARRDLLGGAYDPDKKSYVMPAEQAELLQVIPGPESQYHLFVYSPKERCFKIFSTTPPSTALIRADSPVEQELPIHDLLDDHRLSLPFDELLNTNLWRLAEYHVTLGKSTSIWVRVQCGAASRIFNLSCNLFDKHGHVDLDADLEHNWQHGWTEVILSAPQDTLAFAVDDKNESLYIAKSESLAVVCHSDELDLLLNNEGQDTEQEQDNAQVLDAADRFYSTLPSSLKVSFATLASEHALSPVTPSAFFAAADLGRQVSDEAYQQLEQALPSGIGGLTDESFTEVLELVGKTQRSGSKSGPFALTRFGSEFMVKLGQKLLRRDKMVLLSLLAVLTFINNDFEQENLHEELHLDRIFKLALLALKQNELRDWLASTACLDGGKRSTLFQSLFIGDWTSYAPKDLELDLMSKLTYWCRQWIFAPYKDLHEFTCNVFATLIKDGLYDKAISFERFLDAGEPWTSYLRGRLYLMTGRPDEAALRFSSSEVVKLLSKQKNMNTAAGLLTTEELSRIGSGEDQYLLHVATLFEEQQLYAYAADYAAEALTHINEKQVDRELEQIDKRRGGSALDQVADARAELKLLKLNAVWEDITMKLFNAQILTGQFRQEQAFATLAKIKRPELRRASLQKLVESVLNNGCADLLLDSSLDLPDEADEVLSQLAKTKRTQQILYAYRVRRGDFRGAAEVLWEQLERLRQSQRHVRDPEEESLPQAYLVLINTLACCGAGEEWLLADPISGGKRKLVTLEQLRQEYVAELDRRSDLQHGRYPLIDHDEMDIL